LDATADDDVERHAGIVAVEDRVPLLVATLSYTLADHGQLLLAEPGEERDFGEGLDNGHVMGSWRAERDGAPPGSYHAFAYSTRKSPASGRDRASPTWRRKRSRSHLWTPNLA